jgi:hypothetical protein
MPRSKSTATDLIWFHQRDMPRHFRHATAYGTEFKSGGHWWWLDSPANALTGWQRVLKLRGFGAWNLKRNFDAWLGAATNQINTFPFQNLRLSRHGSKFNDYPFPNSMAGLHETFSRDAIKENQNEVVRCTVFGWAAPKNICSGFLDPTGHCNHFKISKAPDYRTKTSDREGFGPLTSGEQIERSGQRLLSTRKSDIYLIAPTRARSVWKNDVNQTNNK